ncbi:SAM-dependent methyltransferase [Haloarculaceae archaeon H-GB2-1]|nr:SAM-dependent methyltransferase [Haloarculaceae archaeon H-GB1-1]MEA5387012.1 SAM-dependent methyltransferase [Haloarculaceae archaeon H-GB11]MEA5408514.1 SAM-dependent methyltransferase [Haloarculaceae archaeon H-GB2-1]
MECSPIGTVRTPLTDPDDAPRQGQWDALEGRIELDSEYEEALAGFDGDSVVVVWWADRADRSVRSYERDGVRGVFTTRSPDRPNPVCLTTCEVLGVEDAALSVRGVDMLDGTPVIDLKPPVVPE